MPEKVKAKKAKVKVSLVKKPYRSVRVDEHGRLLARVDLTKRYGLRNEPDFTSDEPNVVCARTLTGKVKPIFDLDFPCRLVESSPGKFHLYMDGVEVDEHAWLRVLQAMQQAGIVQPGWSGRSWGVQDVFLRLPGVEKTWKDPDIQSAFAVIAKSDLRF